jgi:DNA-binding SARP family transcriptional activator
MKHFEKRGDYRKCIEYSKKYLKRDIYAENIYQQLMRYYSQTGYAIMIYKTFEICKENIVNDLECPISKETEELYRRVVSP